MKLSPHAEHVLKRANELGYFPTPSQAKKISAMAADEYYNRHHRNGPGDREFNETIHQECNEWAIAVVMEKRKLHREIVIGDADTMTGDVAAALVRAKGKKLRVTIEEI